MGNVVDRVGLCGPAAAGGRGRFARRGSRLLLLVALCAMAVSVGVAPAMAADTQPPTTSLSVSPLSPNGLNGWYVTPVTVTLTRNEPGATYYQWNTPGNWLTYTPPLIVPEGAQTLYYYSEDTALNTESVQSQALNVDTIAPGASISSPSQDATVTGTVSVQGTADDANFTRYTLEYGAGKRPLPPVGEGGQRYGTWWRQIIDSASSVPAGTLASWDTSILDNSYHTLRLVVWDQAGNTSIQLRAVKVENSGRLWLDEVTMDPVDYVPDISADGQKIAFSSDRLGNIDNWVASPGGTLQNSIATNSAEDRHPSFSPDGQSIVFMSERAGDFDIWKSNVSGTGLVQLTSSSANDYLPTWSHDGLKIVYVSDAPGNRDIYIMNANGSGQTALASDPADDYQPDISPDGTKVAFSSTRYGTSDIFIVNADGTGLTRVTSFSSGDMHPTFSSDGQKLAFQRNISGGSDIWTVNVDGTDPHRLTSDPAPDLFPTWSPDGTKIVFASGRSGLLDIYSMNANGSGQQRVTFNVDDFIPDANNGATKIAFTSNRARNYTDLEWGSMQGDIYTVDPNGSNVALLTDLSSYNHHPSFSPDGQQLTFVSDQSGSWDVWKMGLNGTGLTQLTSSVGTEAVPTWGPDGRIVYNADSPGNDDIFIMNSNGSAQTAVTTDTASDRFPDIVTDGSKVGFSSNKYGPGDVFTIAPDGTGLARLTPDPVANEWHPSFGPNGTELTFVKNTDLYRMALDGTGLARLTYDAAFDVVNTWSADGRTVVFSTSRTTGDANRKSIWKMAVEPDAAAPSTNTTPPVTTLALAPPAPDGPNGWYRSAPAITLSADEPGVTEYQWDSTTGTWLNYSLQPPIVSDGSHTLFYRSTDASGNVEAAQSLLLEVDTSLLAPDPMTWERVATNGFGAGGTGAPRGVAVFGGRLYFGSYGGVSYGAQVWSSPDGRTWSKSAPDGFGSPSTTTQTCSLAVFSGYLYASTQTSGGGEVWRTADGSTWERVAQGGFGDAANIYIRELTVFGSKLFAFAGNPAGCEVWSSSDGTTWSLERDGGFGDPANTGVFSATTFGGYLYAGRSRGTPDDTGGTELWRTSDGSTWDPVGVGDFAIPTSFGVRGVYPIAGELWVGFESGTSTSSTGGKLYRSTNGVDFTPVNLNGFCDTDALVVGQSICEHGGAIYVATRNHVDGASLMRSTDGGAHWAQVNAAGFGQAANAGVARLVSFNGGLIGITFNTSTGAQVWVNGLSAPPDTTPPVTTVITSPAAPDGSGGWFKTAPSVALTSNEPGVTHFRWDGQGDYSTYLAALTAAEGSHTLEYCSEDADGNGESTRTASFKVDSISPSTPGGLQALGATADSVSLQWSDATDAGSGLAGYRVYRAGASAPVASATGTSVVVGGLSAGREYTLTVHAIDAAGNLSAASPSLLAQTQGTNQTPVDETGSGVTVTVPDVGVPGADVTLTFQNVTGTGGVSVTPIASQDREEPAANFRLLSSGYFNITPTATFTGFVDVTLSYNPSEVQGNPSLLKVFHWHNNEWEDITLSVDTVNHTITGRTTSFSDFSIQESMAGGGSSAVPASSPWSIGLAIALAALVAARRRRLFRA